MPTARTPTARPATARPANAQPMAQPAWTQPDWARAPMAHPTAADWDEPGHIIPTTDDDPAYTALLNEMGIPQNERQAMKEPAVKRIVKMLARPQPPAHEDDSQRPSKRMCPSNRDNDYDTHGDDVSTHGDDVSTHEDDRGIVHIKFPRPPAVDTTHLVHEPNAEEAKRIELIKEALQNVNERLRGMLPEHEAPDFVKPRDKTTDVEFRTYLDYDAGITVTPRHGKETNAARFDRLRINKHIWTTFRIQYEADLNATEEKQARSKGQIYINGRIERPNDLHNVGFIWPQVFCYHDTNTVFYGDLTGEVIKHILSPNRRLPYEAPEDDLVYHAAPGGYPQTVREVEDLVALCKNGDAKEIYRIGGHILLRAFYQSTQRITESLHDEAMRAILNPKIYTPEYFPACARSVNVGLEFDVLPPKRMGRRYGGKNDGFGLEMPYDPFNVVDWAIYFVVHQPVGSINKVNGLSMDFGGRIRLENLYAYLLVRAIRPASHNQAPAVARYTIQFASVVARPHLYEERIAEYNERFPDMPFVEQRGPNYTFAISTLNDSDANNFSSTDLTDHLIRNGMPVKIMNHCYAYGRQFLDQTFYNVGRVHASRQINAERVERLQRFGMPPTIPEWTGWYTPTYDVMRRIKYVYHGAKPGEMNLDDMFWTKYGADHAPPALVSDPYTVPTFVPKWDGRDHSAAPRTKDTDTEMANITSGPDTGDNIAVTPTGTGNTVTVPSPTNASTLKNGSASSEASIPESPLTVESSLSDDEMDGEGEPEDAE
ncbi:hypothetical protein HYPSUDRAFT_198747 [Hypholoma sublateritium FD-334 SS-4]|uniref:Uncharacterized protein n=1 Tax=Hypholoma sublateritium (strain FD-334 SS-4) TaxID=945553 RepID=A0A0D2MSJ9_HYPSF|nr:hypothetical protein HYPSUDRAFT_198747 [Hypholoma sublateritium FD-334 SS-4]